MSAMTDAPPQVDETLEHVASDLRREAASTADLCGEQTMLRCADAISAHARKANEGVNQRLLKAANDLLGGHVWGAHGWASDGHLSICSIRGVQPSECTVCSKTVRMMEAIRAAESDAPGESLEKELAEALRSCLNNANADICVAGSHGTRNPLAERQKQTCETVLAKFERKEAISSTDSSAPAASAVEPVRE